MTVRIVTDSIADLPAQVVRELGITVVPLNVRFGTEVYRDGIDLTVDQFYARLLQDKVLPVTSVPSPRAFVDAYDHLAEEANEILAITVSARLSGVHEVAVQSIGLMKRRCRVEVLDSRWAVMAQGFIVMAAARAAMAGASLDEVLTAARRNIARVEFRAAFDTLEYLKRGGRIGRAQALLGSLLNINPIIGMKDGEVVPIARRRTRVDAIDYLYDFARGYAHIEEMAIEDAAAPEEAEKLAERLGDIFLRERIYRSRTSPAIGTHSGPGLLAVSVMGDK